jgi:predicted PurR-regulated permease PerM
VRQALLEAAGAMRAWLLTKLLLMVVIGVAVAIGLTLLKVPGAFVLGLVAALLTFIPNFGPFLAAAPAVLLGLAQGPQTALYVVLLYLGVQVVESYVLEPVLAKKVVDLPPALTLTMQIVMGVLLGAVGLAVATPLTAAGVVLIRRLYVEDVLGDV